LRNLAVLAERAPVQARNVIDRALWLAESGFPHQGRPTGIGRQRYSPVPPQGIFYRVDENDLVIIRVADARRRRRRW